MEAGFYETDITPLLGMEMPGGFEKDYIKQVNDRLKVRASVISDGENRVAFAGVDVVSLCFYDRIKKIRSEIKARCGIPASNILIAASHSHSAGPLARYYPEDLVDAPQTVRELLLDYAPAPDPLYYRWVAGQIVTAVCEADRRREKAVMCAGKGDEGRFVFNRRFKMKNGRVYTHPGKGNPDIIEPAGPVDPDVGVLGAWSEKGNRFLGAIVNYACHGTVMTGKGSSADWVYYLEKTVRSCMGEDAVVVFLNGACGDITQADNRSMIIREYNDWFARRLGGSVGAEALKVFFSSPAGELAPVRAERKLILLNRRLPEKRQIEEAKEVVEKGLFELKSGKKSRKEIFTKDWIIARGYVILDWLAEKTPRVEAEIQAIQVGPVVFLANPAEYFCSLGLKIKKGSPFPLTFVVELANGAIGYVPDREAFLPSGGGYETFLTHTSNMEVGTGEKIAEVSLELARMLKPGSLPEKERLLSAVTPWEFGKLGPDVGVNPQKV
ncbi:MAG TPA: hypothetical protein PKN36_06620 [bacterium]|nr:hypothetical protein [bacterium]